MRVWYQQVSSAAYLSFSARGCIRPRTSTVWRSAMATDPEPSKSFVFHSGLTGLIISHCLHVEWRRTTDGLPPHGTISVQLRGIQERRIRQLRQQCALQPLSYAWLARLDRDRKPALNQPKLGRGQQLDRARASATGCHNGFQLGASMQ